MSKAADIKPLVTLTIPGRCMVKKNGQRTVGRGRNKRVVYTPQFAKWWAGAMAVPLRSKDAALIDYPVTASFRFYFKDRQAEADTSNLIEGPQDLLVKLGVLQDDRFVVKVIGEKFFGHEPRVEIEIYKYNQQTGDK